MVRGSQSGFVLSTSTPIYILKTVTWTEYDTSNSYGSPDYYGSADWLGMAPQSVTYSVTTTNPGVSVGQEITALMVVGAWTGGAPYQRTTTRVYLQEIMNQGQGFVNAVQLSRHVGLSGSQLGTPVILPESLNNLPITLAAGGIGCFASAADTALGVASGISFRFKTDVLSYANYLLYLTGTLPSADPTTSDTLYNGPFSAPDNGTGLLVRVTATLPGRTNSKVAYAYYMAASPANAPELG